MRKIVTESEMETVEFVSAGFQKRHKFEAYFAQNKGLGIVGWATVLGCTEHSSRSPEPFVRLQK